MSNLNFETLGPPTKADAAFVEIRRMILQGELPPGHRIDHSELASAFGLSTTPLREALRRLESEHLVVRNAHRDVVVAPLSESEARDLISVREQLDVFAARLAAERMSAEEIAAARKMTHSPDDAYAMRYLRKNHIFVAQGGHLSINRAFHRMIYCGSHNEVLIQYRDAIGARAERYSIAASANLNGLAVDEHVQLHEEILRAIEAHDAERTVELTYSHYHTTVANFADVLYPEHR